MSHEIQFYFDAVSPYTYLATTQVEALESRIDMPVRWIPFYLGGVMKATGNAPPALVPARGAYMFRDLRRWSKHYGVPFHFPKAFPINTLTAQRALTSLADDQPALREAAHRLFRAYWVEDRDISRPEVLAELLPPAALAAAAEPAVKARLKAASDEAVAAGAFGAPTFLVGRELFFGNDRLPFVEAAARRLAAAG
jgi:2-hydroxychromene-2-carboxylate isomerase